MKLVLQCILLFAVFFLASLVQVSFLPYFSISGALPNVIFTVFFLSIFFANTKSYAFGLFVCIIAGFFLDLISSFYFGVSMAALLGVYAAYHLSFGVLHQRNESARIFYFLAYFAAALVVYNALLWLLLKVMGSQLYVGIPLVISMPYSLLLGIIGFYVVNQFVPKPANSNQLKLL